ncbi:keratinocyte-associated protein 3 isoform X2 [Esox lucius]|uniref:Transmembrane protein 54b n=1 Tax=Esox lucius TaxID=8010 RepID=A0A3P8YSB4_ESOLU|nr:keratinocyte-associated protein 3 isoform X2 [Esox lucius]
MLKLSTSTGGFRHRPTLDNKRFLAKSDVPGLIKIHPEPKLSVCCADLKNPKALMKTGLSLVLVGHVNFLLGALVHGVVIRHIGLDAEAGDTAYAISNVVAITAGLMGVVVGIMAIILSKNKTDGALMWSFSLVTLVTIPLAMASVIGLTVSMVRAILYGGRNLLTHCRLPDAIGYHTKECPFDPTHIYRTTLVFWAPLIVMCCVQLVFSVRCFSVSLTFLGLCCCPSQKLRPGDRGTPLNAERPPVLHLVPKLPPPPSEPSSLPRSVSRHPPHLYHSDPSHLKPQRQYLRPQQHRGRSDGPKCPEENNLLERGSQYRTSSWI